MTPARPLYLPQNILKSLQETAARMNGLPLDDLVAAAAHGFRRTNPLFRSAVIREFWLDPLPRARLSTKIGRRSLYELVRSLAAKITRRYAR
jgi:hypothetical protein